MQRHAHGAETCAREPGTVEGCSAGWKVSGGGDKYGERVREGFDALEGKDGDDGVRVAGIKRFDCKGLVVTRVAGRRCT